MQLRTSAQADADLRAIHLYGTKTYGTRSADEYLIGLLSEFDRILQMPLISRERLEVRPPVRVRTFRGHNIVYTIEGDRVTIIRVLHHSADWLNLL